VIDFHTHQVNTASTDIQVLNLLQPLPISLPQVISAGEVVFSVGLHPWYLDDSTLAAEKLKMEALANEQNVLFMGECGLDRLCNTPFKLQEEAFIWQISLAEKLQKPMVIHCVKAYSELIAIKKKVKPTVPMIVHGFNANEQICKQLIQHGFYLSFGAALLNEKSNAYRLLSIIPKKYLFLETDDKNCTISSIFARASHLLAISVEDLQEIILQNFISVSKNRIVTLKD
jgi:TatD DNase family protein